MSEYKKNDIVTVRITDIGNEGEGIGKTDGFTLFIKDAVIGDLVEAKIMKAKKNYAYAHLEKILEMSPDRVTSPCPVYKQCGGCQLQPFSYEKELLFKQNKVRNNLIRIGGFDADFIDSITQPIVGMDNPWRYRNKAQFPIGKNQKGELVAGFYAGHSHNIISCEDCLLGVQENKEILDTVLNYMRENHVEPYQELTRKGLVRHVLIRKGFATGELMVCLVINGKQLPKEDKLVKALSRINNITSVSLNFNTENTNVILGKECRTLYGKDTITDKIREISFQISPLSFYQVNPVQTEKLYGLALDFADLTGQETVWDLYCGIGTISLFLSQKAKQVYGVEIIPQAIEDAKKNADINGITNAEFFVGKAEEVLPEKLEKDGIHADVIVVDPPRKGCDIVCLETILKMQPQKVVYVSCDSATMARDVKILTEGGYELKKVRAVDQFGHTVHVETVCCLQRVNM